jgi:hypothetical protein
MAMYEKQDTMAQLENDPWAAVAIQDHSPTPNKLGSPKMNNQDDARVLNNSHVLNMYEILARSSVAAGTTLTSRDVWRSQRLVQIHVNAEEMETRLKTITKLIYDEAFKAKTALDLIKDICDETFNMMKDPTISTTHKMEMFGYLQEEFTSLFELIKQGRYEKVAVVKKINDAINLGVANDLCELVQSETEHRQVTHTKERNEKKTAALIEALQKYCLREAQESQREKNVSRAELANKVEECQRLNEQIKKLSIEKQELSEKGNEEQKRLKDKIKELNTNTQVMADRSYEEKQRLSNLITQLGMAKQAMAERETEENKKLKTELSEVKEKNERLCKRVLAVRDQLDSALDV